MSMRAINNRRSRFQRRASIKNQTVWDNPDAWRAISSIGTPTESGVDVGHKSALGYPPLWRAVNLIANAVEAINLYLYERDENNRPKAYDHPSFPLMAVRPNEFMTAGSFKHVLQLHAQLDGNGYAWIERDNGSDVISLWVLNPADTYPVVEVNGLSRSLHYVTRDNNGDMRRIPARNMLHIKGPSYDGFMGLSVLDVMKEALGLGIAARKFSTLFFGQGLNARGFLMVPHKLGAKDLNDLREQWPKMEAGLARSHLPVVLHGGMDWKSTQVNPDDAQAMETRQFEIREVANIVGVPAKYLGDDSSTSYNSLEMESQEFLTKSVDPWLGRWESECNAKLLKDAEQKPPSTHYFEFQRSDLIRVNQKELAEINRWDREMGVASVNDILRKKNQPTIGPEGDVHHVPANWVILTDQPPEPAPVPAREPTETPGESGEGEPDEAENRQRAAILAMAEHRAGILVRSEADQVFRAAKREKNFIAWLEKYYPGHQEKIAAEASLLMAVNGCEDAAETVAHGHVKAAMAELLDACDGEPDRFTERIEALCESWKTERAAELAAEIMGA